MGPVTPPTGCSLPTDSKYGVGIAAIKRTDVRIEGPGIIEQFERWGNPSQFERPSHCEEGHDGPQLLEWNAGNQHL